MSPTPSLQDVIHLVEADTQDDRPLSRLGVASALVQTLAEVGDAALGYFVDQARHAGHSWSEIGEALGVSKQAAQQKHTVRLSLGLNAPTFERFTPRARHVVSAAEPIARAHGHASIDTEHILLALYHEPEGLAAQILNHSDFPANRAKSAVDSRTERGPGSPKEEIPFTAKAIVVFRSALASALEMGHNYIGTEHLLLGLSRGEGLAAEVLEDAGLPRETLERKVTEKLADYVQPGRAAIEDKRTVATPTRTRNAPAPRATPT